MKYPDDFINKIICGDCLEVMRGMPNRSVDFSWFDPPYNVGKKYGIWNDKLPDEVYLEYVSEWVKEVKRISGNHCAIYIPTKYKLKWWSILGDDYREIILSYSPSGAIRYGFSNQFSTILCNVKPIQYTKNVWHNCQMSALGWFFKENNFGHPGYTSEDITKRVLSAFTKSGQIILDPFLGSGTTAVACKELGRKYIGIEISPEYCEIARRRIMAIPELLF